MDPVRVVSRVYLDMVQVSVATIARELEYVMAISSRGTEKTRI